MTITKEISSYIRNLETALQQIANYSRGGTIIKGTPAGDRDEMIGIARTALPQGMWRQNR